MHVSYISLAFFAIGAIAAPAAPKPSDHDIFEDVTGGYPFNPTGSSSIEDSDDGFGDFPSALEAMNQALSVQQSAHLSSLHASHSPTAVPKPTSVHGVANFPTPSVSQASSLSHATPTPHGVHPTTSHGAIPTPAKTASASTSSAIPSPSVTPAAGPLGSLVHGLPIVGGLVGDRIDGLGLRR